MRLIPAELAVKGILTRTSDTMVASARFDQRTSGLLADVVKRGKAPV